MAESRRNPPPPPPPNNGESSITRIILKTVTAYSVPLILLATSIYFQLVVVQRNFPPSHYDVLGIPKYSSIEEVTQAYHKITSQWNSGAEVPPTVDLIKVRYAFELLTDPLWKRDYDIYNIDEQYDVIEKAKENQNAKHISDIELPLIKASLFDPADQESDLINSESFLSTFEDDKALLIQMVSFGSNRCAQFSANWRRIVHLLDGVAKTGMVDLADARLAMYLVEKKSSGQPVFRSGVPSLLAFPPGCKSANCLYRYEGELSVDAITDWFATSILNLPRIPYHSKESLVQNFLLKSKPHQVKVIFISKTGERATPFIRQAAKNYSSFATFAFALWKEEDSSFWWNMLGVESAPAIVFLKDPGVEPVVYQGSMNSSSFADIMEKNKYHVLPQLRNLTSMELGCDVHGYSRAGQDTKIWYCAIVAGRPSQELNKMRETIRRVQHKLSSVEEIYSVNQELPVPAEALRQKRLTFAWLDGEAQHRFCFFHIHSEHSYETCGPRRGITDAPQLFIVRYERNDTDEKPVTKEQPKNIFHAWHDSEPDPVSILVAKYNGSSEIPEIIKWISQTIKDGDSRELPPFKTKAPELVPEDADQSWSQGSHKFISSGISMKQQATGFMSRIIDYYLGDPRIGPSLLLGALMSFGLIWLNRSRRSTQSAYPTQSNHTKEEERPISRRRRNQQRKGSNQLIPPSITDTEPIGANQMAFSDSDTE